MKTIKNKASNNFYNSIKDDPEKIIKWCEEEVAAYQELIKMIKEKNK